VPLTLVHTEFLLADVTWYAEEETLFVFYHLEADQGLNAESQVEIEIRTDTGLLTFGPLGDYAAIHRHEPQDCGPGSRCGSHSLHLGEVPRAVELQLRYHPDGAMVLPAETTLHVVGSGAPHSHRSLVVYGVFDETNTRVQWRSRHVFPALRNEEVQDLGLRRFFSVAEQGHGDVPERADNAYLYGFAPACPALTAITAPAVETFDRAVWNQQALEPEAGASAAVCAHATVTDALGTFVTTAVARRNPVVRPAFPTLRSPIQESTLLGYMLAPCFRAVSPVHRAMQEQRLLLSGDRVICVDSIGTGFADTLATRWQEDVDQARAAGNDMALTIALHHDDRTGRLRAAVEEALEAILPVEQEKSSPRLVGAFVFDSAGYTIESPVVSANVLWCPANDLTLEELERTPDQSERSCAIVPDVNVSLGPFRLGALAILPTRQQYLTFIDRYSEEQAGRVTALKVLAPVRTPVSENVPMGEFAVATFFNDERVTAASTDAFSHCNQGQPVVFRVQGEEPQGLDALPLRHAEDPAASYGIGLRWDFPFLLRMDYEAVLAAAVTAFGFSVPFGQRASTTADFGPALWERPSFDLRAELTQCTLFCDHPVFDSAGVYNVLLRFFPAYGNTCYRPRFPALTDSGFPLDP
jgi:hypothetical protein